MRYRKFLKILGVLLPVVLFLLLIVNINTSHFDLFEDWIYENSTKNMPNWLTYALKIITYIGNASSIIIISIILYCFKKSRKYFAIPVSLAVICSAIFNVILKNIFTRERPNILRIIEETDYSFPSRSCHD